MKTLIPTSLLSKIEESILIDSRFSELNQKQHQKLTKRLIELWLYIYNKQQEDEKSLNLSFYTDISSKELKKFEFIISDMRLYYKDLLSILGPLIISNESYFVSKYYIGYKVNTSWLQFTNLTEFDIDFDKIYNNTLNKEYWIKIYPKQKDLIEDAYTASVKLDDYLYWLNNNVNTYLKPVYDKKTFTIKERQLTPERIYSHFTLALKINMKNLWFKLSNEGRFYNSISNLPDRAVDFITLDGYDCTRIDIANMQPLLLSSLVNNKQYTLDCEDGLFYDKLLIELKKVSSKKLDRSTVKIMCYKHIFFGSKPLKSGDLYDSIEKLYKGLVRQINVIKEEGCLAKRLQTLESDIFVKKIGSSKVRKFLRHDEVVIRNKDISIIKTALVKEFNKKGIEIKSL